RAVHAGLAQQQGLPAFRVPRAGARGAETLTDGPGSDDRSRCADDQSTRAQRAEEGPEKDESSGASLYLQLAQEPDGAGQGIAAEARGLYTGADDDAEEAEFGAPQDRPRAPHEWHRGDGVHPRRGPLAAGALRRIDPWRTREGSAGRALPHY